MSRGSSPAVFKSAGVLTPATSRRRRPCSYLYLFWSQGRNFLFGVSESPLPVTSWPSMFGFEVRFTAPPPPNAFEILNTAKYDKALSYRKCTTGCTYITTLEDVLFFIVNL